MAETKYERLGDGWEIAVSREHTFGTDAYLLADFAAPKVRSVCCDLGTGCGIIPMLWLKHGYGISRAYAVEISASACELLTATKDRTEAGEHIEIVNCDMRRLDDQIPPGTVELVACNPPYFASGSGKLAASAPRTSARHESEQSCTIYDVCQAAARLLKYGGRLCVCQRTERLPDAMEAMRRSGIEPKRLRMVLQRPDKAPWLFLLEGKKGGKPSLKTEPPLILEDELGGHSAEVYRIYRMTAPQNDKQR